MFRISPVALSVPLVTDRIADKVYKTNNNMNFKQTRCCEKMLLIGPRPSSIPYIIIQFSRDNLKQSRESNIS